MSDEIRYRCGHTAPRNKEYKPWHKCPSCHRADDSAAKRNAKANLPPLTGSDTQLNWAESVRDKAYRKLSAFLNELDEISIPELQPLLASIRTNIGNVLRQTEASWWIERRDQSWRELVVKGIHL